MKEYQIQIKLVNYLKTKKLSKFRFFHVPNQGVRSTKYKFLLSSMGLKAGCPDLILEFKGGKIVYVEIKAIKGVLSKSQKLWYNISSSLKTPHYILKGEINDLKIQLNNIITKHYET
mgnify:FL=1